MANPNCPLCNTELFGQLSKMSDGNGRGVHCPRCGKFRVLQETLDDLPSHFRKNPYPLLVASHLLAKSNRASDHVVTIDWLTAIENNERLPSAREQLNNLLRWIGNSASTPEQTVTASLPQLSGIIGTGDNENGAYWLVKHANSDGLLNFSNDVKDIGHLKLPITTLGLTFKGWTSFEDLQKVSKSSNLAFMAMQFGDGILMDMYTQCFKPALKGVGLDLRLVTEAQPAGLIDNQIRAAIRDSRLIIADLTHDNRGAYWEAGFGEGLGLPVIYTCEKSKFDNDKTHFDTNHMLTVTWRKSEFEEPRRLLVATIKATIPELMGG